jgi:acetyltransferase-like isoleucine patch superfamily enzyme
MEQEQKTTLQERLERSDSAFTKYRTLVIGDGGYAQLLLYEFVNFFCMPLKGRLGILVRKLALPFIVGKAGKRLSIGANCTFRNGKKIFIGDQVVLEDDVSLDVKPGDKSLVIGNRVHIGRRTILNCAGGVIDVGEDTEIGSFCRLGVLEGLSIGHHCVMGNRSCISGAAHSFSNTDMPIIQQPLACKGHTTIGDFVTIGERVTLLDGVSIGNNVTILSDSLVNKNVADGLVVSGVPACVVP